MLSWKCIKYPQNTWGRGEDLRDPCNGSGPWKNYSSCPCPDPTIGGGYSPSPTPPYQGPSPRAADCTATPLSLAQTAPTTAPAADGTGAGADFYPATAPRSMSPTVPQVPSLDPQAARGCEASLRALTSLGLMLLAQSGPRF